MCSHQNIITSPEDEYVCTDCGVVLGVDFCLPQETCPPIHEGKKQEICQLEDICQNFHLPYCLIESTHRTFQNLSGQSSMRKKYKHREILALAFVRQLYSEQIVRSPEELAAYFDINYKKMRMIYREVTEGLDISITSLLNKFCAELNIPFQEMKNIEEEARKLEKISCSRLETVTTAAIYAHAKGKIPFCTLSRLGGISEASIRMLVKKSKNSRENK